MIIPADKIQSVRLLCLMLTAVSLYALIRPHTQRARIRFVSEPLSTRQARIIGVLGLLVVARAAGRGAS